MLQSKDLSKQKIKETLLFSIDCSFHHQSEKKAISLQFYNSFLKILDLFTFKSLGIIFVNDFIRVEWMVREYPQELNAFEKCDGFFLVHDDIYKRSKVAQENGNDKITKIKSKSDSISSKNSSTKGSEDNEGMFQQHIAEFLIDDTEILKQIYTYFAPRVIMKQFHDHYKAVKKLGKGSFASVYLVVHRETEKQMAIKAFLKEKLYLEDKGPESFFNEINLMKQINHPHLLKLYEIWESNHSFYYVIELANGGSLMDRINQARKSKKKIVIDKERDIPLSELEMKQYMKQLIQGLLHLRERRIMHRDIKPDNILLRRVAIKSTENTRLQNPQQHKQYKNEAILIDFGLGTLQDIKEYMFPKCGTPGYVAPEIINLKGDLSKAKYSTQCDMFSLGATFYFMLTLKPLFIGQTTKETIQLNKKCSIDFCSSELKDCDRQAIDLLRKMLEKDPNFRIDPKRALKHPFFNSLEQPFDDDLVVPDENSTSASSVLQKFAYEQIEKRREQTFDMSRINSLINSSLRTSLGTSNPDSVTQAVEGNIIPNQQNLSLQIRQQSLSESLGIESNSKSLNKKGSLNDSPQSMNDTYFINKNHNIYGNPSKNLISQSSFDYERKMTSDSLTFRQDSFISSCSLKMKAHTTLKSKESSPKNQGKYGDLEHSFDDQIDQNSNNLLSPVSKCPNSNLQEGRTKSPSRFRMDFEKIKTSSEQFNYLDQICSIKKCDKNQSFSSHIQQSQEQAQANSKFIFKHIDQVKEEITSKLITKQSSLDKEFNNNYHSQIK